VQAGVSAGALGGPARAAPAVAGARSPGVAARTLGGIAATNASGRFARATAGCAICCSACASSRPTAVVTWGGSKVVKSVSGYDVPKLMVGALARSAFSPS